MISASILQLHLPLLLSSFVEQTPQNVYSVCLFWAILETRQLKSQLNSNTNAKYDFTLSLQM